MQFLFETKFCVYYLGSAARCISHARRTSVGLLFRIDVENEARNFSPLLFLVAGIEHSQISWASLFLPGFRAAIASACKLQRWPAGHMPTESYGKLWEIEQSHFATSSCGIVFSASRPWAPFPFHSRNMRRSGTLSVSAHHPKTDMRAAANDACQGP